MLVCRGCHQCLVSQQGKRRVIAVGDGDDSAPRPAPGCRERQGSRSIGHHAEADHQIRSANPAYLAGDAGRLDPQNLPVVERKRSNIAGIGPDVALAHLRVDENPPREARRLGHAIDHHRVGVDHRFIDVAHRLLAIGKMELCAVIACGMADPQCLGAVMIAAVGVLGGQATGFLQRLIAVKSQAAGEATEGRRGKACLAGDIAHRPEGHFDRVCRDKLGRLPQLRRQAVRAFLDHVLDVHRHTDIQLMFNVETNIT